MAYLLNKVLGSQVGQSGSTRKIEKFGKVHLLSEYGSRLQPVREAVIVNATNPEGDSSRLLRGLHGSTLKCSDGMDLVMVGTVQSFHTSNPVPYSFINTSYRMTLRQMKTIMQETVDGLPSCGHGDDISCTSTQTVNRTARWDTPDPYSRLLLE